MERGRAFLACHSSLSKMPVGLMFPVQGNDLGGWGRGKGESGVEIAYVELPLSGRESYTRPVTTTASRGPHPTAILIFR